jgi:hypothetical protein
LNAIHEFIWSEVDETEKRVKAIAQNMTKQICPRDEAVARFDEAVTTGAGLSSPYTLELLYIAAKGTSDTTRRS